MAFALFLFSLLLLAPAAQALPAEVHVNLFEANTSLTRLIIDGPMLLDYSGACGANHLEFLIDNNALVSKQRQGKVRHFTGRVLVRPASSPLLLSAGDKQRHYRGYFVITLERHKLHVENIVESKAYIASVVGSESLPDFPLEALKAQAILAATVLARHHGDQILGDTTEVQAYLGSDYERPLAKQSTEAVFGQQLKNKNGFTAAVYYHSTCAGGTSDAREIFSGKSQKDATINRVQCSYCRESPFFKSHSAAFSSAIVAEKLGYLPLSIEKEDQQRRPLQVKVKRVDGSCTVLSGYQVWLRIGQKLGWHVLPGMRYSFAKKGESLIFKSNGAGHGAGLCQWGASAMARSGKSYLEILQYYFPDCSCSVSDR